MGWLVGVRVSGVGRGGVRRNYFLFHHADKLREPHPGNIWTLNRFCPALVPAGNGAAEAIDLSGERGGGGEGLAQRSLG